MVAGGVKVLLVALVVGIFWDYFHQGMVIEPITVPKWLSDDGVTDAVAAQELRQRIYLISKSGGTLARTKINGPGLAEVMGTNNNVRMPAALSAEQPDLPVPTTSISINTVFDALDDILPWSPRTVITGEFISDDHELHLVVFMNKRQTFSEQRPETLASAELLIGDAADAVVTATRPDWEALDLDQNGHLREANRLMDSVIYGPNTASAELAQAHLLRAWFLREEALPEAACNEIKASLRIDPENPDAYKYLSSLLLDEGRVDLATADARKAVILSWGRDSLDYSALGTSYYYQQKWFEAERAYRQAIWLRHDNWFAQDALGRTEENEGGRDSDALAQYTRAIVLESSYIEALNDRARLLTFKFKTDDALEEAKEDFTLAGQLSHWRVADPWLGLGWINDNLGDRARDAAIALGDYKTAADDFRHALRIEPRQAEADFGLGFISDAEARYRDAAGWFLNAVRRDPSSSQGYYDAIDALRAEAEAKGRTPAATVLENLANVNPCTLGTKIPDDKMVRDLVNLRCGPRPSHGARASIVKPCAADSSEAAFLPNEVLFHSLAATDQIQAETRLAVPALLIFVGFMIYGWRGWRRITPRDR
jgi:tetratricopeptide (TPR) repeat protein